MSELEQINATITKLQNRRFEVERKERHADTFEKVGQCFKYLNSYGSENKKFYFYSRVIGISEDGYPVTFTFQTDCFGNVEVKMDDAAHWSCMGEQIQLREFRAAHRKAMKQIATMSARAGFALNGRTQHE